MNVYEVKGALWASPHVVVAQDLQDAEHVWRAARACRRYSDSLDSIESIVLKYSDVDARV